MKVYKIGFTHSETKRRTAVRLTEGFMMIYASMKGFDLHDIFDKLNSETLWCEMGLIDFINKSHDRFHRQNYTGTFVSFLELIVFMEAADMLSDYNEQNKRLHKIREQIKVNHANTSQLSLVV